MSELAYMTLSDWGQQGTAMEAQSARIREWLGAAPYLFAVASMKDYQDRHNSLDRTVIDHIVPEAPDRTVVSIQQLRELIRDDTEITHPITVLRPFDESDCDLIAELVGAGRLQKVLVIVHHASYPIRVWLDGMGAVNLHTGASIPAPDPVLLEAAKLIQNEDYNGLSSGHGKDAIVALVRAFAAKGYPVEPEPWVQAYFALGGSFRHAASISKLVAEMKRGVRHRVKPRYRDEIFTILSERVAAAVSS
ncbi:hypothetical protein [Microbacterium sp. 2FI]|uniref:hypothetical protein n=1 Tax=Microbacterium sp. 2FI TaxID=2502193 RepID=UPI0010F76CFB|nr:hypothetical protein [Microbacterium sp. 2FI]